MEKFAVGVSFELRNENVMQTFVLLFYEPIWMEYFEVINV